MTYTLDGPVTITELVDYKTDQALTGVKTFESGLIGALTGNADTSTKLESTVTIGGVEFDGSANIDLPGVNLAGTMNTTGSAATLTTARTIGGVPFNGSANIDLPGVNVAGTMDTTGKANTAGTADLATLATNSSKVETTVIGSNETQDYYVSLLDSNLGGSLTVNTHSNISFNASTGVLTSTGGFNGQITTESGTPASFHEVIVSAGNIDATTIGSTTAAEGTFTNVITEGSLRGPNNLIINPADSDGNHPSGDETGTVTIQGDLTVKGTTTTIESTTLSTGDNIIELGDPADGSAARDAYKAGLMLKRNLGWGGDSSARVMWHEKHNGTESKWMLEGGANFHSRKIHMEGGIELGTNDSGGIFSIERSKCDTGSSSHELRIKGMSHANGKLWTDAKHFEVDGKITGKTSFKLDSNEITSAQLAFLDVTSGTAEAGKALVLDTNKDIGLAGGNEIRNLMLNGELDFGLNASNATEGQSNHVIMKAQRGGADDHNLELTGIASGAFTVDGDIIVKSTSDQRLKDNIKSIENPLEKVKTIGGYTYTWNKLGGEYSVHECGETDVGVIAQEVEGIIPEAVINKDNGYKAVHYEKIIPLLVECVKEQQDMIEKLQNDINMLKN